MGRDLGREGTRALTHSDEHNEQRRLEQSVVAAAKDWLKYRLSLLGIAQSEVSDRAVGALTEAIINLHQHEAKIELSNEMK